MQLSLVYLLFVIFLGFAMATLLKSLHKIPIKNSKWPIVYQIRNSHWNKDWKPAPVPTTSEENLEAAKKYGLLPQEYKHYDDDGFGLGDYPKLPDKSVETRDPFYPWDFPEHKRNLNEPLHADIDMIGEDRYNISGKHRYSLTSQVLAFLGVMGGSAALYIYLQGKKMFRPVLAKQYPSPDIAHYTFEPQQ